jgi:telomere length regulation protein
MDDILTAVKTARNDNQTSLSTAKPLIEPLDETPIKQTTIQVSPAHILESLKTHPGEDELYQALRWLDPTKRNGERGSFDIRYASPLTAPILQTLASNTIPDHWKNVEKSSSKTRGALLRCLCSIAGVRALVTSLQISINALRTSPQKEKDSGRKLAIQDIVSFLAALLRPVDFVRRVYQDNASMYDNSSKRRVSWLEFCSLLAGGKLLSTIAEALSFTETMKGTTSVSWIGEGASFSGWLGLNMSHMVLESGQKDDEFWKAASVMIGRAIGLGHTDKFVHELYTNTFEGDAPSRSWHRFFDLLRPHEQVAIVQSILKDLQATHFSSYERKGRDSDHIVGGVAALVSHHLEGKTCVQETIQSWLSTGNSNVVTTVGLRRVLLLLYSRDSGS